MIASCFCSLPFIIYRHAPQCRTISAQKNSKTKKFKIHGLCRSELTMGSILVVCLVGELVSVSVEANVGVTVLCRGCICIASSLLRLSLCFLFLCGSLCQFLLPLIEVFGQRFSPLGPVACLALPGLCWCLQPSFMSSFMTSQHRSCSRLVGLFPRASSLCRRSLGMWPSGMWWTLPSQRRLHCLSSVNMLGRPCETGPQCWAPCLCCLCYKNCYFIKSCSFC